MSSSNRWSTNIMRSIRRLNWCALYGMCRCFHLPYIGCMETRCSILIWHAAVLGKHFHFLKNLLIFLFCLFGSSLFLQLFFARTAAAVHIAWIDFGQMEKPKNHISKDIPIKFEPIYQRQTDLKFAMFWQQFCWCRTKPNIILYFIEKKTYIYPNGIQLKW